MDKQIQNATMEEHEALYRAIRKRVEEMNASINAGSRNRDKHIEKLIEIGKIGLAEMYRDIYRREQEEYHCLIKEKYILAILTGRYDYSLDLLLRDHDESVRQAAQQRFGEARAEVEKAIAERLADEQRREAYYQALIARPPKGWGTKKYVSEEERQRAWEWLDPRDRLSTACAMRNKADKAEMKL